PRAGGHPPPPGQAAGGGAEPGPPPTGGGVRPSGLPGGAGGPGASGRAYPTGGRGSYEASGRSAPLPAYPAGTPISPEKWGERGPGASPLDPVFIAARSHSLIFAPVVSATVEGLFPPVC